VGGVKYKGKVVSVKDVEALEDLYDTMYLAFDEDGKFLYILSPLGVRGTYEPFGDSYLLKSTEAFRLGVNDDGELTVEDSQSSTDNTYIIEFDSDYPDALVFGSYDADTGTIVADDMPLYLVKDGSTLSKGGASSGSGSESGSGSGSNSLTRTDSSSSSDSGSSSSRTTNRTVTGSGNQSAVTRAQQYLRSMPFSHDGLVDQLEYEGFSHTDAVYGADACGADWNEQALLKAKRYLDTMGFSESGLKDQLEYEGFTADEAAYGVAHCGADWNEQAVRKAKSYLNTMSFSHSQLVDQLEYEGFTHSQAEYGADHAM
jgi:hypothetical protein